MKSSAKNIQVTKFDDLIQFPHDHRHRSFPCQFRSMSAPVSGNQFIAALRTGPCNAGDKDALKHQGVKDTSRQLGEKYSVDALSENSNDSARNIHRFIRLTELLPELLQMVDDKKLPFNPAVELSYLTQEQQGELPAQARASPPSGWHPSHSCQVFPPDCIFSGVSPVPAKGRKRRQQRCRYNWIITMGTKRNSTAFTASRKYCLQTRCFSS